MSPGLGGQGGGVVGGGRREQGGGLAATRRRDDQQVWSPRRAGQQRRHLPDAATAVLGLSVPIRPDNEHERPVGGAVDSSGHASPGQGEGQRGECVECGLEETRKLCPLTLSTSNSCVECTQFDLLNVQVRPRHVHPVHGHGVWSLGRSSQRNQVSRIDHLPQ